MMKRIIALLLALILTVGLLPTVALAATTETSVSKTEETHQDNLNLVKTVTEDGDNYKVKLEAWATGKTVIDETKIPLDIVLVLDESGSMEEDFTTTESTQYELQRYKRNKKYKDWADSGNLFFKDINGNFYQVTVTVNSKEYVYAYKNSAGQDVLIGRSSGKNARPRLNLYRKYTTTTVSKNKALKDAANSFIDAVYGEAVQYKLNHRIAIVTYSNNAQIRSGGQQVKNAFVTVNTTGNRDSLKGNVNNLQTSGSTYIDKGIQTANSIFAANQFKDGTRARVMIVFTDGGPGQNGEWTKSGDSHSTANNAISYAKTAIGRYKATVYTIGIFDGAAIGNPATLPTYYPEPNDWSVDSNKAKASNSNRFMHLVSSNYPGATSMTVTDSINENLGENKSFYLAASSAGALSDVFETINEEISTDTTTLGEEALIIDKIPGNFAIPANTRGITLTVANYKADGSFEAATTAPAGVTPKYENNTVTVTGFDFSDNWCGVDQDGKAHGQKLIIEFTIKHNNYGGTQPTNDGAGIADKDGLEIIKVSDPKVLVKISAPADIFAQETEKPYDGTGFDILGNVASKANSLADGTKNKFVDIEVKVTVGGTDYTYTIKAGQPTGTWSATTRPTTSADVKDANKDGVTEAYEYPVTITFKDAAKGSTASNSTKTKAKFKINYAEVTVKANNKTKKTTEADPPFDATVTGMVKGENANEKLTYTITRTDAGNNTEGAHNTITPSGGTYQNNYKVTYETGTLTITKDDTTEITVTITGTQETKEYNGQTQEVVGFTYTVEGGAAHDDVAVTLKTGKEAKASGKDVLVGTDGKYDAALTYPMHLTADCFDVSSTKYSNVTIEEVKDGWLKITPIAITLKSGDASKTYDGAALTKKEVTVTSGNLVSGEGLDYVVTGSQTEVGTSKNTYTYTPKTGTTLTNYTITKEEGDLTVTLPDLTALPTVTVDCINSDVSHSDKTDITLTAATQYELGDPQKVTNEIAYTRTITLTDAGKEYCIGEYNKDIAGHTEAAGGTTTITLKYSKEGSEWAWRANHNNFFLNVRCTTPTVNVDLGNYIKKTLTGTNFPNGFTATFKVEVSYGNDEKAEGNVTLMGAAEKTPFTFSNITLKQGFYYIFSVTEQEPSAPVPGVKYDKTAYEFALNVKTGGTVEYGSVEEGQFVPAAAESVKFVTIKNEYTRPSETFDLNTLITKNFEAETNSKPIPNGNYTFTAQIFEANEQWQQVGETPAYIGTATLNGAASGAVFDFDSSRNPTLVSGTHRYLVKEEHGGETIDGITYDSTVYRLTITVSEDGTQPNVQIEAEPQASVLSVQSVEFASKITFTNTYFEEKDPNKLTINFADFVKKELTATGSKTVDEATFIVDVVGSYDGEAIANALPPTETQATTDEDVLNTTLTATIKNIVGGNVYEEPFTGSVTVSKPGHYTFTLTERKGTQSGVTYDEAHYQVFVNIMRVGDNLVIHDATTYLNNEQVELIKLENDVPVTAGYIVFKNTIDTGKDDYYPIIIPTIINKDTGMLNKTDHFAYVIGYPDGTVHPNGQITRAEVATIFFRLLRDEVRDGAFTTSNTYSDVAYGKWYNNPISTMSALGIITGYPDGTFKPNKPITRAEFAAIAARFDETQSGKSATFSDVIGHWAAKEIGIAYYNDWIKGYPDGTFKPDQNITRAEAMTLINRVLERKPESPADLLTNMNKWTDNMDTSKWYYLDVQEATNSHGYTRKTFNYELWRQMLPDPDWSRYER